VFNSPP